MARTAIRPPSPTRIPAAEPEAPEAFSQTDAGSHAALRSD